VGHSERIIGGMGNISFGGGKRSVLVLKGDLHAGIAKGVFCRFSKARSSRPLTAELGKVSKLNE